MPEAKTPEDDHINLCNALRTAFSHDADPELFISRATDQIRQVQGTIIETCSKNRIRVDDNLYALLEARDAIAEQNTELDKSAATAANITNGVNHAVDRLNEKINVRRNLDAALAIAAQTRKLTRMYARIEDTIDSRRLYTALRMLRALEEELRSIKPGTVLLELIPDTHRLRAQITMHSRKAFHSWLTTVRKFHLALGEYALNHASSQFLNQQSLFDPPRFQSVNEPYINPRSPLLQQATFVLRTRPRAWSPLLSTNATAPEPIGTRVRPMRSLSAHRVPALTTPTPSFAVETNVRPEIGADTRSTLRSFVSDNKGNAPKLYIRPLLQSVQVNEGLDLLSDMRADYVQERKAHLLAILNETEGVEVDGSPSTNDMDSVSAMNNSKASIAETCAFKVCGFFVVERAVESNSIANLVSRNVVDTQWWPIAREKLRKLLKELSENSMEGSPDKAKHYFIEEGLRRFAEAQNLSMY